MALLKGMERTTEATILVKGKDGSGYITLEQAINRYDITYEDGGKRLALTNKILVLEYPATEYTDAFTLELRNTNKSRKQLQTREFTRCYTPKQSPSMPANGYKHI